MTLIVVITLYTLYGKTYYYYYNFTGAVKMREREKWKTDKESLVSGGVDLYTDY